MKTNYQLAADVFDQWRDDVLTGEPPILFPVGRGELARVEIGPQRVTLIGGAPAAGKTAFTMQCVIDALRLTTTLRAVVCNVEMPAKVLLDRQLARLSGVAVDDIRYRRLGRCHADRIDQAMNTLEAIAERLCFVRPPFDLANVAATADGFNAELIVLDYIQRISAPGKHGDRRGSVDATMNYLRQFADAGVAVIVVAAVARTKDKQGRSSYSADGLNLASFRESSELEFGADDAFILAPYRDAGVQLKHLKARHTEPIDIVFDFDGATQSFIVAEPPMSEDSRKLRTALATMWNETEAAPDD